MQPKLHSSYTRIIGLIVIFVIALTLSACVAPSIVESPSIPVETPTAAPAPETVDDAGADDAAPPEPMDARALPVQFNMPALDLTAPVTPMGWRVAVVDDAETTAWVVPDASLGWQVNSAAPGEAGNMIIVGHQALGDALLAPLALDEMAPGQEVLLTDDAGATFRYQISEVSDPLPVTGASEAEKAQAAAYTRLDGDARLTLISGWPDFTTSHRVFAVAEFMEAVE